MLNVCRDSRVVRLGTIACTYCLVHERLWICVVCSLRRKLTLLRAQPCNHSSMSGSVVKGQRGAMSSQIQHISEASLAGDETLEASLLFVAGGQNHERVL